ncbi:MAG: hypothetical protein U9R72_02205 [Chloroflexota bacterium]|nr:hypothetical protein [Chloroflexota bacterium]
MRSWHTLIRLVLVAAALTACGAEQATEPNEAAPVDYQSDALDTRYEGALDVSAQLALGSLQLEGTEHAVTAEQSKTLLPLWQALQGGVTAEGEVRAVLKGIEGGMTEEQLTAIADMRLTQEDVEAWIEEQGMGARGDFRGADEDPDARATRQAEGGGQRGGQMLSGEDMPPEMATRVAEFGSVSEEEREAIRATARAGGSTGGGFRGGADAGTGAVVGTGGQLRALLCPLITLLEARAGEA